MKNQKVLRSFVSCALLVSGLALLTGCGEWFKKSACPGCDTGALASAAPGDVLLSIDGKPAITKESFNEFFDAYINSNPQAAAYLALDPSARRRAFQELEMKEVIKHDVIKKKKDQTPEYKKKFAQACDYALWAVNSELFRDDVLASIDSSDAGLEKFYNENKGKNPAFDVPPFQIAPEGIKMQSVQFSDQKSARDFLEKAQKAPGEFAALAKAIKKDVKDLGLVTTQEKDYSLKAKAKSMQPNAVDLIFTPATGKYVVIKAVGQRQNPKYAEFAELKANPETKELLANTKKQTEFPQIVMARIEELKKELNAVENLSYFDEEEAKKKAELEAKMKELQVAEDKEDAGKQGAKPAGQPVVKGEAARAA